MRKITALILAVLFAAVLTACGTQALPNAETSVQSGDAETTATTAPRETMPFIIDLEKGYERPYTQKADGTWECNSHTYQYRLEQKIIPNISSAYEETVYVYLSNIENLFEEYSLPFEMPLDVAVLVEARNTQTPLS